MQILYLCHVSALFNRETSAILVVSDCIEHLITKGLKGTRVCCSWYRVWVSPFQLCLVIKKVDLLNFLFRRKPVLVLRHCQWLVISFLSIHSLVNSSLNSEIWLLTNKISEIQAYAAAKFADACLRGLRGDAGIIECSFVASQVLMQTWTNRFSYYVCWTYNHKFEWTFIL